MPRSCPRSSALPAQPPSNLFDGEPMRFLFSQLHASSDRSGGGGGGGYRSGARGCGGDPLRTTTTSVPVVQRRKQSDHLFGLLLEICHISPAETQLLLRSGTISRWVEARDRGKVGLQRVLLTSAL